MAVGDETTVPYRPVGQREFELVRDSGFTAFPPRLPEQPFFYPVVDQSYAERIAREWNVKDAASGCRGYVLRFRVRTSFLAAYEIRQVGDSMHREYWIPAADLDGLNDNMVAAIELLRTFPEPSVRAAGPRGRRGGA